MGTNTKITWADHTFNAWWGCQKVSPGCDHCYALDIARYKGGQTLWGPEIVATRVTFSAPHWHHPVVWNAKAEREGVRHRVFCNSMADVFDNHSLAQQERPKLWDLIGATPWLDWLLLTKRPGNIWKMIPEAWRYFGLPKNIWLGVSAENQVEADRRIPALLDLRATIRFISFEPLLEHIAWRPEWDGVQWAICGGESGRYHRQMKLEWAQSLHQQATTHRVPYWFKQISHRYPEQGEDALGEVIHELPVVTY